MMDIYDQYDPNLIEETRKALKLPWYSPYCGYGFGYVDVETEAEQVKEYSVTVVPGLLQTEQYAGHCSSIGTIPGRTTRSQSGASARPG